jgi:hypothetical protein
MHHALERKRFSKALLGWTCTTCTQMWTREPTSLCPGVRTFHRWDTAHAAGYRTTTQWRKEGRKLKLGATPSAAKTRAPSYPNKWYDLYAEDQTTPIKARKRVTSQTEVTTDY